MEHGLQYNRLPSIDMYGGDETTWIVEFYDDNGTTYKVDSLSGYDCVLTLSPFAVSSGLGENAEVVEPVLTKDGSVTYDNNGETMIAMFQFVTSDTIDLRGKYMYQIEVDYIGGKRIGQGYVLIRQNINRRR